LKIRFWFILWFFFKIRISLLVNSFLYSINNLHYSLLFLNNRFTINYTGYGNLAPTNTFSRILMIFYGLIGIPMNGILLTQLGDFFSQVFIRAYQKYKSYKQRQSCSDYHSKKSIPSETRKTMRLAAQIFLYLTPGFIVFIFFPAILFSYFEKWTYEESVYYAFVTLTTIGFGDFVAGKCPISISQTRARGTWLTYFFYQVGRARICFRNCSKSRAHERFSEMAFLFYE